MNLEQIEQETYRIVNRCASHAKALKSTLDEALNGKGPNCDDDLWISQTSEARHVFLAGVMCHLGAHSAITVYCQVMSAHKRIRKIFSKIYSLALIRLHVEIISQEAHLCWKNRGYTYSQVANTTSVNDTAMLVGMLKINLQASQDALSAAEETLTEAENIKLELESALESLDQRKQRRTHVVEPPLAVKEIINDVVPVSYTHLTLPTKA